MKSFKKLAAFLTLTAVTSKTASGAPILAPNSEQALQDTTVQVTTLNTPTESIPSGSNVLRRVVSVTSSISTADSRKGILSGILRPILTLLQPASTGISNGLHQSTTQLNSGIYTISSAAQSTVKGVGKITGGALNGLGGTLNQAPTALYHTTKNLEKSGTVGTVVTTLTGAVRKS